MTQQKNKMSVIEQISARIINCAQNGYTKEWLAWDANTLIKSVYHLSITSMIVNSTARI